MFGYVTASLPELSKEQRRRYQAVYCGICRRIRAQSGQTARLGLRYDMAFLALLLMSLYEPREESGGRACALHPGRSWVDDECIRYAADMNTVLAYYHLLDDWQDDGKKSAKWLAGSLEKALPPIEEKYPRQCAAIRSGITALSELEQANCPDPDRGAGVFGALMAELLTWEEDHWAPELRQLGDALGRFIYLMDAALDYDEDRKKGKYNPYLARGGEKDRKLWEEYLVLTMGRATEAFERLPLVQDKALLDNILYSGVWMAWNAKKRKKEEQGT